MRRFFPVLTLVVMAPVVAELLWGSTPISRAAYLISQVPMDGAGALLIRDVVRRSERGWASVLLLGVAYGLVEEGLAIQWCFNPTLFGAADWGARIFGILATCFPSPLWASRASPRALAYKTGRSYTLE